jgi:glutamine synthetase
LNKPLIKLEESQPHTSSEDDARRHVMDKLTDGSIKRVRFAFADLHGETRCKTLFPKAARHALEEGLFVAGTTLLKDTSDRTAIAVFDAGALSTLSSFANASNLLLKPDPSTFKMLPWSEGTAWILCNTYHADQRPCEVDARHLLQSQVRRLQSAGYHFRCGIELEFHVYKIRTASPHLNPAEAAWPGPAPEVDLIHPGYRLLSEHSTDAAHQVLALIEDVACKLALPLSSLEIEFGPSQFEAVFEVQNAIEAADCVVLFRSAVRQALARHGYLATFMCRPPFASVMSSGWHLHQSLCDEDGLNAFSGGGEDGSPHAGTLSKVGGQWLAGLMHHALAACVLGTTTANGYARYQPGALAPTQIYWGYEDRSALFRVVGDQQSLRIENRLGEPSANPYLYLASQIICGLDGLEQKRAPGAAQQRDGAPLMPSDLNAALQEFRTSTLLQQQLGPSLSRALDAAKTLEWKRFSEAEDQHEFQRREYFGRF